MKGNVCDGQDMPQGRVTQSARPGAYSVPAAALEVADIAIDRGGALQLVPLEVRVVGRGNEVVTKGQRHVLKTHVTRRYFRQ